MTPFENVVRARGSGSTGLPKSAWEADGRFPVIGQGAEEIEGWTDREDLAIECATPLVLYGGHTRRAKFVDRPFVPGPNVRILDPVKGLDAKFLFHFLTSLKLDDKGYADHFPLVRRCSVPVPSLEVQKRLVAVLDDAFAALDSARANAEANLRDTGELYKGELSTVFRDEGAPQVQMRALFDVGSSKRVLKSQWQSSGVPFYRGREVTKLSTQGYVENDLFITEEHFAELKKKYGVPTEGDLVITAIGTIGNAHIVRETDRFYFKDASVLWMKKNADVSSEYVLAWLKSPRFFEQLDADNGATVDTLTIQKLQGIKIRVPSMEQQHRIVKKLRALRVEVSQLQASCARKIESLEELRQALLQAAFSGQLT